MEYEVSIVPSKVGIETLKVNDYYIHSKYNPLDVAQKNIELLFEKNYLHIVFGYGLGYEVDELLQNGSKIVIVDPLITQQKLTLQERHRNHSSVIYWGTESFNSLAYTISIIEDIVDNKINVICLNKYDLLFTSEYKDLLKTVRDYQVKSEINRVTVIYFAEQWQSNLIRNLDAISNDLSSGELIDKFHVPVVIASGGPSLTKQLPLLKEYEENVLIIAAGSTVNSLLASGIVPDFVVTIDGGEPNYKHFKGVELDKTRIIYSVFNHYGIRESFKKKGYVFANYQQGSIANYFREKFAMILPLLVGGGTVAHSTYSAAHMINSGPIAMIGQDLAYTNNQSHAENNRFFKEITNVDENNWVKTIGYYDEEIYTSEAFYSMKTTFEEVVRLHEPKQPTYNCTEGGVKIQGMEQLPFEEFLKKYANKDVKKDLSVLDEIEGSERDIDLHAILSKEIELLKEFQRILIEAIQTVESNKSTTYFEEEILLKLEVYDDIIKEQAMKILIQFLIQPITIEVETLFLEKKNETAEESYRRIANQTKTLYQRLKEASEITEKYVVEILTQIKESQGE